MPTATILIVEDDPVFRRILSFVIAKTGFEVEAVSDGETGFERIAQGGIDFLITDYQMPGCSGVEFLRQVRQMPESDALDVILCTARSLELDCVNLREEFDLVDIIQKPFSPQQLNETVTRCLQVRGFTVGEPTPAPSEPSVTARSNDTARSNVTAPPPPTGDLRQANYV